MAKIGSFSSLFNLQSNQSISISVIFGQTTKAIAYFLAKSGSFSSLFNLQSKSINFNFGHFWPKYQGYSLTFRPNLAQFDHFSICNQNQSMSISIIFGQNTKAIALLFDQNCSFSSLFNLQSNQSISISVMFGQNTKAIALLFGKIGSFSSLFNLQSKSINFNFGHFWPKYQGYSLTFWPKLAHFHHFSICNQNQSISISVMFGQNTKAIALLFGQNWLIFITFLSSIKINQFQFRSFLAKIPRL